MGQSEVDLSRIGYEEGSWYMVPIGKHSYPLYEIPGRYIGLTSPCPKRSYSSDFPHPGMANFENILLPERECGYKGAGWDASGGSYPHLGRFRSFIPSYREVTANELWQVEAIERFQKLISGQRVGFDMELPSGDILDVKVKPAKRGDDLAGRYDIHLIDPKTGEEKSGWHSHPSGKGKVRDLVVRNFPGWHIINITRKKVDLAGNSENPQNSEE